MWLSRYSTRLGKPHSLMRFVKDRPGHDRRYAIDPSLIESELGWNPLRPGNRAYKRQLSGTSKIAVG